MALVVKDRVRETTTTVGTGTLTLSGAVTGFQSFSVIGNGNTTYYTISDGTTGAWEVGIGTYTSSGTTLSRDTVLASSNSGNLVNFSAGTKDVFVTYPAGRSVTSDVSTTFTAAQTFRAASAVRSEAAATQDAVVVAGRAGGTNSYAVTLTPTTLTASRTFTLPDADGTALYSGGPLGTPSSGTVTNLTGTASININGTVGATTPAAGTFTSLTDSGNLTFTGTGNRITGDMSNATQSNRVMFQSSTTNGVTAVALIPNGTATTSSLSTFNGSDPNNAARIRITCTSSLAELVSDITGTGTLLPISFNAGQLERMRLDTSGNLGIGVSPNFRLESYTGTTNGTTINSRGYLANAAVDTRCGTIRNSFDSNTAYSTFWTAFRGGGGASYKAIFGVAAGSGDVDVLTLDSSGNVGIGTSSPGTKLDVLSGTANTAGDSITSAVATFTTQNYNFATALNPAGLQVMSNSTLGADVGATIGLGGRYTGTQFAQFAIIKGAKENATDGNFSTYLAFGTRVNGGNITERMRIDSSGNVGIGTSSPGTLLEVYGGTGPLLRMSTSGTGTGAGNGFHFGIDGSNLAYIVQNENAAMVFQTNATDRMRIDSSGNVGIGASAPGATGYTSFLALGNNNAGIGNAGTNKIGIVTNNVERILVDNAGNVGIGTSSPGEELHVVGQGYFTAGCYIGSNSNTNTLIDDASNGSGTTTLYIGNASITTSSDARLKENVTDTEVDALAKVQALRVVDFTWNDPSDTSWNNKNARGKWTGLIAQEAIAHVPWAVNAPRDPKTMEPLPDAKDEQGNDQHWFMEHGQLVPLLVKSIQEQQQQIDALKAEVAALKGE